MFRARFTPLAAALTVAAVALVGCGESTDSADSKAGSGPLAQITVKGDAGAEPTVTVAPKPLKLTGETKRVVTDGKGEALSKTDLASVHIQVLNGTDGKVVTSTWQGKQTLGVDLSSQEMLPILVNQIPGSKPGGRLLLGAPASDVWGPEGNPNMNLKAADPVLFVVDVINGGPSLKEAEGTAVAPKAGLPTVKWNPGKAATITMPKTAAPAKLVTQPLIAGKGAKVESGQTVRVSYTGALWRDGKVFDSNADGFTTAIGVGQVVPGWDKSIVGQPVGSRLLLVVPPADGYGEKGQGEIKGTDTMVFVVDILAAV
ncbi:peptidyl-prolyl cis-trans isomerase [Knoellia sinensis KCTC 19936]|uniref:Peptidyl-prolyl cis-trans isomerase n=1 Tax=Knoellia sinensis KCTC 19936 TaxID=1385520 RepID=A0A0A0J5P0_9MICO|nr:FKBP-type peptidyl-prolyl cis-trans isomerase [Knoellia sinensis]KGN32665.1 peptidyl-prolyl cis-trans isomerase [Knoellia sinensis KCTC 19936]